MKKFSTSYAQVAEDLLAAYYLKKENNLTYIDVGCLWTKDLSNTYYFYERMGRGICIDPNPSVSANYATERPRDIFENCGVARSPGVLTYYSFENPVFNTFSNQRANELIRSERSGRNLIATQSVPVCPLHDILKKHEIGERFGSSIDLLSIDVEGFEHEVVSSLDFSYVKPRLIIMEEAVKSEASSTDKAKKILTDNGYRICGQTGHDIFFIAGQ